MINEKGANLLKNIIKEKFENVRLDNIVVDENEFYYEFKVNEEISEKDLEKLEKQIGMLDNQIFIKDALGREMQIPTIQVDFSTPKRFGLFYIDERGEKQIPVMVHRAILGSYERFLVLLLEQFKGVLPIWLSPVQVNIIPVNNKYHDEYCKKIMRILQDEDIRVQYDDSNESMSKKIKLSNNMKNPYTLILGNNELDKGIVSYRKLGKDETISLKIEEFIEMLKKEIK